MTDTKICVKCGIARPLFQYSCDNKRKDKTRTICQICNRQNNKAWRAARTDARSARTEKPGGMIGSEAKDIADPSRLTARGIGPLYGPSRPIRGPSRDRGGHSKLLNLQDIEQKFIERRELIDDRPLQNNDQIIMLEACRELISELCCYAHAHCFGMLVMNGKSMAFNCLPCNLLAYLQTKELRSIARILLVLTKMDNPA